MPERVIGEEIFLGSIKSQLQERKSRLNESLKVVPDSENLCKLLKEVDFALERINKGTYGLCEVCKDPVETDRLLADPLATLCLDHLNNEQRRVLERDLEYAGKIQRALLPKTSIKTPSWEYVYHYRPAGTVSGDFCDLIEHQDNSLTFIIGDVSGKGVAASLMMSHLHALIHSLLSFNLPVNEIMERTNRLFCESTLAANFATMVLGRAMPDGTLEMCVAGHNPPLIKQNDKLRPVGATGLPIGLFCNSVYGVEHLHLQKGDTLFLYTDGLSEAEVNGVEYGENRIKEKLSSAKDIKAGQLINDFLYDHLEFTNGSAPADDVTFAVLQKI